MSLKYEPASEPLHRWMESYNYVYGLTRNPYSRAHSAGGSSGGEAALVAASCVSFGLGSLPPP